MADKINKKYDTLKKILKDIGKVVVAYSGGVDSTFLLKAAVDTLTAENVLACIAVSPSLPKHQFSKAIEYAEDIGAVVRILPLEELSDPNYSANKADRCFHCKSHLFKILNELAENENYDHVICGSNFDDKDDYRPGNRAAQVFEVRAPLMEAELTKEDIRNLSRDLMLPTADVPASPCLASRLIYGLEVT
ncbi:MAG: ATP-dependent sacrificial sulfur transferase LarE, partial [Planctomycetota bacterium]